MNNSSIVSLDIGGTTINAGRFRDGVIEVNRLVNFNAHASEDEVLKFVISCIDSVIAFDTQAITIGVPCIVDVDQGIVFDAVNIPAWQKYPLKAALFQHYQRDIYINNDVNCFVAGEYGFGAGQSFRDVLGICLGTGIGSGLIINHQLHAGHNCCAGEVGGISYLNGTIDDYCSGQFFVDHFKVNGEVLAQQALAGDEVAIESFKQFGQHLAKAISYLLFIIDPQMIVFGGSVAKSYPLFIESLWQELRTFPYQGVINNLTIAKSELENAALLGAVHLYRQSLNE